MKAKDIVYLVLAGLIFATAGVLAYSNIFHKTSQAVQVEVVTPISPNYDQSALAKLNDQTMVRDFAVPVDLLNGLGNQAPFGP